MTDAPTQGFDPSSLDLTGVLTFRTLDLCTSHITKKDNALLRDGMDTKTDYSDVDSHSYMEMLVPGGYAMPHEGGWLVRVFAEADPEEYSEMAEDYSEAFLNLLALCRVHEFDYLRLDRDGDTIEGLPTFDW